MISYLPNQRRGVDAGWHALSAIARQVPRATHAERWLSDAAYGYEPR
jgi:hypothetical protein